MLKVTLVGRVAKDPETKKDDFSTFLVAEKKKNKDGGFDTTWVKCLCFKYTHKYVSSYVHKGDLVYVEGDLSVTVWQEKPTISIFVTNIKGFGGSKKVEEPKKELADVPF